MYVRALPPSGPWPDAVSVGFGSFGRDRLPLRIAFVPTRCSMTRTHQSYPLRRCSRKKGHGIILLVRQSYSYTVIPAVDGEWTFLAELIFRLMYLSNKVYEPFGRLGHALFRPVGELELSDSPRSIVDCVGHFEFSEYVLWHVIFRDGFNDKCIVSDGSLRRPVLIAFFLKKKK